MGIIRVTRLFGPGQDLQRFRESANTFRIFLSGKRATYRVLAIAVLTLSMKSNEVRDRLASGK